MKKMRAKFKVHSITRLDGNVTLKARPVTSTSPENKSFWKYTPSGLLELDLSKDCAAKDFLEIGEEFYLDFIKAESK